MQRIILISRNSCTRFLCISVICSNFLYSQIDFTTQVFPIFQQAGCLLTCHGTGNSGQFTMGTDAPTVYSSIVNKVSHCNNLDYVEPFFPDLSFLYHKCAGTQSCGSRMPRNNQTYFDTNPDQLQTIYQWILEGATETVSISRDDHTTPDRFQIVSVFPNPFNASTSIVIESKTSQKAEVSVFDLQGEEVVLLYNGWLNTGRHTLRWEGKDRKGKTTPSGMYFLTVRSDRSRLVRKIIYLQ